MKNYAKIIAIAIALLAVFFVGCKNTVEAVLDTPDGKTTGTKIEKLTVVATSDDSLVKFTGSESRTVLPGALVATDLSFYLWGIDVNDNSNTSISTPKKVQFNATDDTTGSVPVNLSVSAYKLKLAAVFSADGGDSLSSVADIMNKAVVYGVADVDLRFNQTVKFYLNPANISGTGTVDIKLRTLGAWKNDKYSVTVRIENKNTNAVISNTETDPVSSQQIWYAIGDDWSTAGAANSAVANQKLASTDGVQYKITKIPSGTYNLVVDFWNSTTAGTGKHFYYTDTLMVLTGQTSNKTNSSTDSDFVEIPDVIDTEPDAPKNLRVGYNNPTNRESNYYLATFEWDDVSFNEEYFVLQILDVTDCSSGTIADPATNKTGFDDGTVTALADVMANAPNDEPTDTLTDGWKDLASHADVVSASFDYTVYQKTDSQYGAGSLNMNSNSVSLWLELGHSYVARLTSVNEASSPLDPDFDKANTGTSLHKWIYTNLASMTGTAPRAVVTETTTSGLSGTPLQPLAWAEDGTPDNGDEPLCLNRYRIEYSLNGGKFQTVNEYGVPINWSLPVQVTDVSDLQPVYYSFITKYATITGNGTSIIDPTIWPKASSGSGQDYVTLYNAKYTFKSWYRTAISAGEPFSKLKFTVKDDETDATKAYVVSDYGKINIQGVAGWTSGVDKALSLDKHVYVDKEMSTPAYLEAGNIFLVANYGSESGGVEIDNPAYYKPYSQNIRVFKSKGGMNATYPFTASQADSEAQTGLYTYSASADVKTDVADYPKKAYTDGEVSEGTFKISSYWKTISVLVVENALQKDNKDIYRSVSVEVVDEYGNSVITDQLGKKSTFVVKKTSPLKGSGTEAISGTTVAAAGTDGSDPLMYYYTNASAGYSDTEKTTHDAFYVLLETSNLTPGHIYTIKVKTHTDENPKSPYVYDKLVFEFTDPVYEDSAYETATPTDESSHSIFYHKNGETYVVSPFNPTTAPTGLTVYKLTGTPLY